MFVQCSQPSCRRNRFCVLIFSSIVQNRETGFGSMDLLRSRASNGSPLRLALLCETSTTDGPPSAQRYSSQWTCTFQAAAQSRTKSSVAGISRPVLAKQTNEPIVSFEEFLSHAEGQSPNAVLISAKIVSRRGRADP